MKLSLLACLKFFLQICEKKGKEKSCDTIPLNPKQRSCETVPLSLFFLIFPSFRSVDRVPDLAEGLHVEKRGPAERPVPLAHRRDWSTPATYHKLYLHRRYHSVPRVARPVVGPARRCDVTTYRHAAPSSSSFDVITYRHARRDGPARLLCCLL